LLQDESLNNNTRIVSIAESHIGIAETLINHFQPFDKAEKAADRLLAIKNVFCARNSEFSPYMNGILNFGKYGISTQIPEELSKAGLWNSIEMFLEN